MSARVKSVAIAIWIVAATLVLGYSWFNHPDRFPAVPPALRDWILATYGANTAEEVADAGLLFGMSVAFLLISIGTAAGIVAVRAMRRRMPSAQRSAPRR
ncbi:hypothetical protein [Burkholderia guangdongensis]|uniref:hypothetical protein n=1 Tax=Burkholderia guangdongensis TaxID=1792500 RepID=UPI0015CDDF5E|nr:hypothetical protein [Burkholderia guangdongensis]